MLELRLDFLSGDDPKKLDKPLESRRRCEEIDVTELAVDNRRDVLTS